MRGKIRKKRSLNYMAKGCGVIRIIYSGINHKVLAQAQTLNSWSLEPKVNSDPEATSSTLQCFKLAVISS